MKRILFASKITIDKLYPRDMAAGGKYNPASEKTGGAAATAAFVLLPLGIPVRIVGRYTQDDEPFRVRAVNEGIEWAMSLVEGRTAINAILPDGPKILRVVPGPKYEVNKDDGRIVVAARPSAIAVGGSMENEFVAFMFEAGAALGVPCFWNPGSSADFKAMDCGAEVYLQVSFADYSAGGDSPAELARKLLAKTAAAGVVVTDAERGAYGICRGSSTVFFSPAIKIDPPIQEVGAGDAHFAGFIAMFLNAPSGVRFERSLEFARLVAARHVSGLPPTSWSGIRSFADSFADIPAMQRAA